MVAAKRVIPRQPIDEDRRLILQERHGFANHDLVGAQHPLSVDDRLGVTRGAGRQQEFHDGVPTHRAMHRVEIRMQRGSHQIGKPRHRPARQGATGSHDLDFLRNIGPQRGTKPVCVVDEHEPRREQLHRGGKLAVIPGDQ